jgi:hypothetical protein
MQGLIQLPSNIPKLTEQFKHVVAVQLSQFTGQGKQVAVTLSPYVVIGH